MYCVKCKRITGTNNIERVVTKNNRNMLRGRCDVCGIRKTQFIKADVGKGVVNKLINNLPFEAHLPVYSPLAKFITIGLSAHASSISTSSISQGIGLGLGS